MTARGYRLLLVITGLLLIGGPAALYAHGTGYRQLPEGSGVGLEFYYSTGEAMSYLEAVVFSPEDEKFAYQSGRTDEFGRVAFIPNVPGKWRVVVKDDEGHLAEAAVEVDAGFFENALGAAAVSPTQKPRLSGANLYVRALLGVSVIFNIALLIRQTRRRYDGKVKTDAH